MPRNVPLRPEHRFTIVDVEKPREPWENYTATVKFAGGRTWKLDGPQVVVPLGEIEGMSNADIGQIVRALDHAGWLLEAINMADDILEYRTHDAEQFASAMQDREWLRQFAGESPIVDSALAVLDRGYQRPERVILERTPVRGFVYLVRAGTGAYKIGRSINVEKRLQSLRTQSPDPITLVHAVPVSDSVWAERFIHTRFAPHRGKGEWFALSSDQVAWFCGLSRLEPEDGT